MGTTEVNYYSVLQVNATATPAQIKQKYRELSKKYHPDTNGGDSKRMIQLNEAYDVLSNPLKRKEYTPPGAIPKPAAHTSTYHATAAKKYTQTKPRHKVEEQEEPESIWSVLFWYVLAVPIAMIIVTFGIPLIQSLWPNNGESTTFGGQTTTSAQSPQTSEPAQTSPVTAPEEPTPADTSNQQDTPAVDTAPQPNANTNEPTPTINTDTTQQNTNNRRTNFNNFYYRNN